MSAARPFEDVPTTQIDNLPRLSHTQRSQLIKSTRKLAKILGENPMPQVNRPSVISPFWKKSRESIIVDTRSSILSMAKKLARAALDPLQIVYRRDPDTNNEDIYDIKSSPVEMNTLSRENNRPSMLVLQAVTSRDSEIDGHEDPYVSSQVPSPAMSSFSKRPPSVISASASKSTLFLPAEWEKSKEEREISHRRKRVSKLARHLGERIPPDLMLPKPMSVKPNGRSQRRRRFLAARSPPAPSIVPPLPAESPTSEQETTPSLSSPSSMSDVSRLAVEGTVEVFESARYVPDAVPRPQFSQKHQRLHGSLSAPLLRERPTPPTNGYSGGIDHSDAFCLEDIEPESGSSVGSPRRPGSRLAFLRLRPASPPPAPKAVLHRSERRQGWSGEWNVESMQDVISKLRDL
ncbi:hypothetical protein F5888DRAFT_1630983 [Russula emetica]|nr:hypothetical protein F5888DRAFT_1630983 [Russula emetica]